MDLLGLGGYGSGPNSESDEPEEQEAKLTNREPQTASAPQAQDQGEKNKALENEQPALQSKHNSDLPVLGPQPLAGSDEGPKDHQKDHQKDQKGQTKPKKKKKKKKKKRKVQVKSTLVKLPDFSSLAKAVASRSVDEGFEDSVAEIAEHLNDHSKYGDSVTIALLDPNKRPKSALEVRSGSRDTGRSGKGGSGGGRPRPSTTGTKGVLVPRQLSGSKRPNVSTEDVEAWTTVKRLKAQRIADAKRNAHARLRP
ncbi:hypothetical protein AAMO2058_001270300 [Amorphochlora amoebiformis]|mmetsp:Transcript_1085/g.1514  ORF Transcript_1085/g.1514 Transcript_1085/m.1514 type:complete len:253 (-) Transcript_1085:190-948(-)